MATKLEVLSQAAAIVKTNIAQRRPPMFETLRGSYELLGQLTGVVKSLQAEAVLPSEFQAGIETVIRNMSAFRSGYASNDPTQAVGPGVVTKRATLKEFATYVATQIEKSAKEEDAEALARLHTVACVIKAGLDELSKVKDNGAKVKNADGSESVSGGIAKSDSGVTIPVTVDPAQLTPDTIEMPGAKNPSGTSSPSTAPTNFVTNPGDASAAGSSGPNPSTDSAVSLAGTGTGGQALAPFAGQATPGFLPGAAPIPGPSVTTSAVMAATGGATNSGADAESFSPDAVAKAAGDEEIDIAKSVEAMRKATEKNGSPKRSGWTLDLNTDEFLKGKRGIDFGADGSK